MFEKQLEQASERVIDTLVGQELPLPDKVDWNPIPFKGEWGFGTAVCFKVAAALARQGDGVDVRARSHELAASVVEATGSFPGFSRVEAAQGYINLYLEPAEYARIVLDDVLDLAESFGRGELKEDRVMVEYAQPNTHHSFHIGHARNAILGEALARIVEFDGFETVRASYPGDVGMGVIRCMWAYDRFYRDQEPEGVHERGQWLAKIYTEVNELITPDPSESDDQRKQRLLYEEEIRQMYRKWDEGEPKVRELWQRTRQWSLDELESILQLLGIHIDVYFYESEVDDEAKQIVGELVELGIAEDERPDGGPVIVKIDEQLGLDKEKYRTAVLLRNDGTTLYLAKDLALAKRKFEDHHIDRSIYVVDVRQSLHLMQAFKILELWGFPQAKKSHHLAYGFVSLPEGAMSSRAGNVVLFMDVVEEAVARVRQIIAEKNPELEESFAADVAEQVALGSLAYAMLSVDNVRDTVFSWERALDFDGQAAPYIQYAHVRAWSILRKAEVPPPLTPNHPLEAPEIALLDRISRFPDEVHRSATEYKPLVLANYAYELARDFTTFYQNCPVLDAPGDVRRLRLRMTEAARQTLANCMGLLLIDAPEAM